MDKQQLVGMIATARRALDDAEALLANGTTLADGTSVERQVVRAFGRCQSASKRAAQAAAGKLGKYC